MPANLRRLFDTAIPRSPEETSEGCAGTNAHVVPMQRSSNLCRGWFAELALWFM